ncbi:hypothetical protein MC885_004281 [Smutsia gigantea]|nr:hypothetical protein MC885_004281 [Smutsia gigantea]
MSMSNEKPQAGFPSAKLDRRLMGNGDEADSNHQGLGPCLSWGAREESKYVAGRPRVLERAAAPVLTCLPVTQGHMIFEDVFVYFSWVEWTMHDNADTYPLWLLNCSWGQRSVCITEGP